MALGRSDDTDILWALYADAAERTAVTGPPDWSLFFHRLARLTRAQAVVMLLETRTGHRVWHQGDHAETLAAALTAPQTLARLRHMRFDRVYADYPPPDALAPHFNAARGLRVQMTGGSAWLLLLRSGDDFRAVDGVALSSLAPHLPLAIGIWDRLAQERAEATLTTTMAAQLGLAWLAFDTLGQIIGQSPAAQDVLATTPHIRLETQHRLRLGNAATERAVLAALEQAGTAETTAIITLSRAPLLQLLVTPAPHNSAGWRDTAALGILRGPHPQASPSAALVAKTFGLNLGEARLAMQLCQGASLAEAAEALGLTIETARNYSKKIFAATGLHGQPDLLRLLLNSAIWLAP